MSGPSDNDRTPPSDVTDELERLGETPADADELRAARHLAAELEGGLRLVDDGDAAEEAAPAEVDELAHLARAMRSGTSEGSRAGEAVTGRVLAELFAGEDEDAPSDDLERRRAGALGHEVDRLVAGFASSPDLRGERAGLTETAAMIRAGSHAQALSGARLDALVDEALGAPAVAAPAERRYPGSRVLALVAVAATLVAGVVGLVLAVGRPETAPSRVPAYLSSRSTRDVLPNAFPPSQSESERIDLIYNDRLRAYREIQLGTGPADRTGGAASRPTPALTQAFWGGVR